MSELTSLTMTAASELLAKGKVSAKELAGAHLSAMSGLKDLNCFVTETPERALAMAEASDRLSALAIDDPDGAVLPVAYEQIALGRIGRE